MRLLGQHQQSVQSAHQFFSASCGFPKSPPEVGFWFSLLSEMHGIGVQLPGLEKTELPRSCHRAWPVVSIVKGAVAATCSQPVSSQCSGLPQDGSRCQDGSGWTEQPKSAQGWFLRKRTKKMSRSKNQIPLHPEGQPIPRLQKHKKY